MALRRSISAVSAVSILLAFGVIAARSRQSDGQNQPSFSSTAQLVPVDTQVTEKDTGRVVDTLRKTDFEIYDEGVRREIKLYSIETAPLDLVIVWHPGRGGAYRQGINTLQRMGHESIEAVESQDRAAAVGRTSEFSIDVPMSPQKEFKEGVRRAFKSKPRVIPYFSSRNGTRLYDTLAAAIAAFLKPRDRNRRRVILALSDGLEDRSKISRQALITDLLEADITLNAGIFVPDCYLEVPNVIWIPNTPAPPSAPGTPPTLPSPSAPPWPRGGPHGLRCRPPLDCPGDSRQIDGLVEATGGEFVCMDVFNTDFLRRIRVRYLLGFYADPSSQREYHRLEVRLTPEAQRRFPTALIRARQGYYSQPGGGQTAKPASGSSGN